MSGADDQQNQATVLQVLPTTLRTMTGDLTDLGLERYLAGELDSHEQMAVDKHLEIHPADAARVAAARAHEEQHSAAERPAWLSEALSEATQATSADAATFQESTAQLAPPEAPPPAVLEEVEPTLSKPANAAGAAGVAVGLFGLFVAGGAVVAAAFVAMVILPKVDSGSLIGVDPHQAPPEAADHTRAKSGGGLELAVFTSEGERLKSGDTVPPGTRLGFQVQSAEAGHLVILGLDSSGEAWTGLPQEGAEPVAIEASEGLVDLEAAVQLDDAGERERLVALRCGAPVDPGLLSEQLVAAAETAAPDEGLPPVHMGCAQDELILHKAAPPAP